MTNRSATEKAAKEQLNSEAKMAKIHWSGHGHTTQWWVNKAVQLQTDIIERAGGQGGIAEFLEKQEVRILAEIDRELGTGFEVRDQGEYICPLRAYVAGIFKDLKKASCPCGETATIPMVERATGRTIPDLTKREHVCEYQKGIGERACGQDERAINLLVGVRDSAVTDDGLCVICLEDPHASGCVMTLVENYIHELDDAELAGERSCGQDNSIWFVECSVKGKFEGWWTGDPGGRGGWRTTDPLAAKQFTQTEAEAVATALDYFPAPFSWLHWTATEHVFIGKDYSRPGETAWVSVEEERLPERGIPIEMTGDSGYIAPHDRFVISGYYDAQYRPLSPWLDSTGTCTADMGWNPTHWRPLSTLPSPPTGRTEGK